MLPLRVSCLAILLLSAPVLEAQSQPDGDNLYYSRKNTFGIFGEYSNDSSHILLGEAANRKLLNFGASYGRRLLLRPSMDLQYHAELRPVALESDPVSHDFRQYDGPPPFNTSFTLSGAQPKPCPTKTTIFTGTITSGPNKGQSFTETDTFTCSRQWTFGEGFSPAGFKFNFLPRHRMQPVVTIAGGYMFSTRTIPIESAGSFNYTFEFGAGFEFYRSRDRSAASIFGNRSVRAEYRYHHISNAYAAQYNPGIDSGLLQITYAFGR